MFSLGKRVHKDGDFKGMKSHNFHVMMQDILLSCMWHLMAKGCRMVIIRLNHLSKKLCNKVVDPNAIANLKDDVAMTMVLLEQQFLLSFFDIMTHLLIHLVEELKICGLVHTCWIYLVLHEDIKGVCVKQSKAQGEYVRRICSKRGIRFLHWIFARLYNHKVKGMGW